jgi:hypothetical protein
VKGLGRGEVSGILRWSLRDPLGELLPRCAGKTSLTRGYILEWRTDPVLEVQTASDSSCGLVTAIGVIYL